MDNTTETVHNFILQTILKEDINLCTKDKLEREDKLTILQRLIAFKYKLTKLTVSEQIELLGSVIWGQMLVETLRLRFSKKVIKKDRRPIGYGAFSRVFIGTIEGMLFLGV